MDPFQRVKAIAAKEQPRQAANEPNRRALPHADPFRQQQSFLFQVLPLDCRLLIWEYILQPSQTRIERWRAPDDFAFLTPEDRDADCFPYRITAAGAEKTAKPLNLLLCCRQLYLEGLSILYSTTFVFERPLDLYDFQLCVSPEGLSRVGRLIIAFGQIDYPGSGPLLSKDTQHHPHGSLDEWENAIHNLKRMRCLQELQIWLGHLHVQTPELERRPWQEDEGNQTLEQRHQKLFDLFGTLDVANFTVHMTWNPEDLLSQRSWPFKTKLHTKKEMLYVLDAELPEKTEPDLYDWE